MQPHIVKQSLDLDADVQPCPECGNDMYALKGSKKAICQTCGYKESCCF